MSWLRPLGGTGLRVSALGLGTVKLGRDQGVRYPQSFTLPDDRSAAALLARARALGINLLDTAPAYGSSEERLGRLLAGQRRHWVICSKVGEEFEQGRSRFDFSPEHTRESVRRSLRRLGTDALDIVLVHSDGEDLDIIERMGTLEVLAELKREGLLRAFGMSTKTVAGGLAAARACDVVMLTYNPAQRQELPVLDACARLGRGALIKKALGGGHLLPATQVFAGADRVPDCPCPDDPGPGEPHTVDTGQGDPDPGDRVSFDPLQASMDLVFAHAGTSAAIVGTIDPPHLQADVEAARRAIAAGRASHMP